MNVAQTTVLNLVRGLGYEGRSVTADNYYSSLSLATELLEQHITYIGTCHKNKKFIPPALLESKTRGVESSLFAFTNTATLISFIPKKGRNVILLSTLHHSAAIEEKKPEIIEFYNKTKGGVDTLDRRIASASVKRATRNWMIVAVSTLMDISINNSFILYCEQFPGLCYLRKIL